MFKKSKLIWVSTGLVIAGVVWTVYKFFTSSDFEDSDDNEEKKDENENEVLS